MVVTNAPKIRAYQYFYTREIITPSSQGNERDVRDFYLTIRERALVRGLTNGILNIGKSSFDEGVMAVLRRASNELSLVEARLDQEGVFRFECLAERDSNPLDESLIKQTKENFLKGKLSSDYFGPVRCLTLSPLEFLDGRNDYTSIKDFMQNQELYIADSQRNLI